MLDVVENLLRMDADVVVTITAPLDRRDPGNDADRVRVRNLVKDARTRLLISEDSERARMLVEQLETPAVAAGDVGGRAHGVVIVAHRAWPKRTCCRFQSRQPSRSGRHRPRAS